MVAWIYVFVKQFSLTAKPDTWLLVAGIVILSAIITVLVVYSVILARGILEVRRQTGFIDSVTHELRSPLASLKLCLETLDRSGLSSEQRQKLHRMMAKDVERLAAFIDDILEANRLEHGSRAHGVGPVQLRDLMDRCVANVLRRHRETDDSAVTVEGGEQLSLVADEAALEVVFKNLIDNAVKYSDEPHRVRIVISDGSASITVEVIDNGVGIDARDMKRVFERFYRAPNEAVRSRRGTGLGLYVVSELVRNMGGKLKAYSQGRGHGTRMVVRLPKAATAETEMSAPGSVQQANT